MIQESIHEESIRLLNRFLNRFVHDQEQLTRWWSYQNWFTNRFKHEDSTPKLIHESIQEPIFSYFHSVEPSPIYYPLPHFHNKIVCKTKRKIRALHWFLQESSYIDSRGKLHWSTQVLIENFFSITLYCIFTLYSTLITYLNF